ncbi:hypothetical protein D3C86_1584500 [compost metagenome]
MAVLAGVGVEQRAQPVAGGRGRRGDHPRIAEKTVADTEIQAPHRRQIGRGHGKGLAITLAHRRTAATQRFAWLGLGKGRGVIARRQAKGQQKRAQAKGQ